MATEKTNYYYHILVKNFLGVCSPEPFLSRLGLKDEINLEFLLSSVFILDLRCENVVIR